MLQASGLRTIFCRRVFSKYTNPRRRGISSSNDEKSCLVFLLVPRNVRWVLDLDVYRAEGFDLATPVVKCITLLGCWSTPSASNA